MEITERSLSADLFQPHGLGPRSKGVHVSDIIRDIQNRTTHPGKRKAVHELSDSERRRMGAYILGGFAWEEILRAAFLDMYRAHGDRFISPGELERDGIYGTPDGFDTDTWRVQEFKCTWRSSARRIDMDFWHWFVQIKAYCWMLDCHEAELSVFFVNGDYRDSGPQSKVYDLEFTGPELRMNWNMLLNHSKGMR